MNITLVFCSVSYLRILRLLNGNIYPCSTPELVWLPLPKHTPVGVPVVPFILAISHHSTSLSDRQRGGSFLPGKSTDSQWLRGRFPRILQLADGLND